MMQEYEDPPSDLDDTEPTQSGYLDSSSDDYSCPTLTPLFHTEKSAAVVVKFELQSVLLAPGLFLNLYADLMKIYPASINLLHFYFCRRTGCTAVDCIINNIFTAAISL